MEDLKETVETLPKMEEVKPEDIITEEIISNILKGCNRPELELVDYDVKAGTIAGDNYMSIMYALKMNMRNSTTGNTELIPIMLKTLPQNKFRKEIIKNGNIFVRDVSFYQQLAPEIESFQQKLGIPEDEIFKPWPKCYASKTDGENDFLAMEDLKADGFTMANRQSGLDFEHCALVVKTLAKYHALSYAMYQGDYDLIVEKYPWTKETMYNEDAPQIYRDMFQETFEQQRNLLKQAGEETAATHMEKLCSSNYFDTVHEIVGKKAKWAVINHGDSWTNNMMFRYDEETKKPIEMKFVDFQLSKAGSRGVDLQYFLYTSLQLQIINEREAELVQIYFEEFTKFGKKIGVDVVAHELTQDNLMEELERCRLYGVFIGIMSAMMMSADSSDIPDMEAIKEEDFNKDGELAKNMVKLMNGKAMEKIKNLAKNHIPKCPQLQPL